MKISGPTRRVVLTSGGLSLVSLGAGPPFLRRLLAAPLPEERHPKVLVSIFQRGAMDGLMAVPPLDDSVLRPFRPSLTMSGARSTEAPLRELDERFGLHPAFDPLYPYWEDGRLAIVHAVGSPNPTRSHFDAQDYMENGTPWRKGTATGWLNRLASTAGLPPAPFSAVSMSSGLPRSLVGPHPALAVEDLSEFSLAKGIPDRRLEKLYDGESSGLLRRRGGELWSALRLFSRRQLARYRQSTEVRYPSSRLGEGLLQIAFLIKARVGLRIAFVQSGGWDTHIKQGSGSGLFSARAADLAASVAAFWADLGEHRDEVVVQTMTEFGRTVRENGSGGTDHGHGSCLFVLGNPVDGGVVHGEVPELAPDNFFEGRDLPVTTDFRAVFAEVAGKLFGLDADTTLFPGWEGVRLPLLYP